MKMRTWLLLALLLALLAPLPAYAAGPLARSGPTLASSGGQIPIAVTAVAEWDPAVAVCASNQYLTVYERGGDIIGQRLEADGTLLGGAFLISESVKPASKPDVTCEWTHDLFVVVWESEYATGDRDILARAVYGAHQTSGSQLLSAVLNVAYTFSDEPNPAIACNHNDQTCLVVFEYESSGDWSVRGRRVEVAGSGITVPQVAFQIGNTSAEPPHPDVAWSGAASQFMVVWQHWWVNADPPSHFLLTFRPFHDTHQTGDQSQTPEYGLVKFLCGLAHGQTEPAIAYSRGAGEYLVAFEYDRSGDGTNYDIAAIRLGTDGARLCPFYVADTSYQETSPAAAYSCGPEYFMSTRCGPQVLVAYRYAQPGVNALGIQRVKDRDDGSGKPLLGVASEVDRVFSGATHAPDVTGSSHTGRYLTAWQRDTGGQIPDPDVLGYLVASNNSYLPVVLREH